MSKRGWVGRVLREGGRSDGRWVRVYHGGHREARLAVVAGREVGGAVLRNRTRRRVREVWRQVGGAERVRGIVVVRIRRGGGEAGYDMLKGDIEGVLRRIEGNDR